MASRKYRETEHNTAKRVCMRIMIKEARVQRWVGPEPEGRAQAGLFITQDPKPEPGKLGKA
jgi:hypothetical protein